MKYRISKENIEFEVSDCEVISLVKVILKIVVPSKLKKLYFSGLPNFDYSQLKTLRNLGLTILEPNDHSTLIRKERIVHNNGYILFVPILSGILKKKEWQPVCEEIISNVQQNV